MAIQLVIPIVAGVVVVGSAIALRFRSLAKAKAIPIPIAAQPQAQVQSAANVPSAAIQTQQNNNQDQFDQSITDQDQFDQSGSPRFQPREALVQQSREATISRAAVQASQLVTGVSTSAQGTFQTGPEQINQSAGTVEDDD